MCFSPPAPVINMPAPTQAPTPPPIAQTAPPPTQRDGNLAGLYEKQRAARRAARARGNTQANGNDPLGDPSPPPVERKVLGG